MTAKRHVLLTLTSWFLVIGCNSADDSGPGVVATSLEGPYACGTMECSTGQLCETTHPGLDSGAPPPQQCVTVVDGCLISDCYQSSCPECISELCDGGGSASITVSGRDLSCGYQ